jgi:hypothetical protein
MGEVRSFTEEHADGVARLYFRSVRGQDREPGKTLPAYFTELHLHNPWATPEVPALVYIEKGKVVGALGILPRDMEFRGRPVRVATMTLYMVDPEYRNGPAAIHLLRRALKGPQDFSWTDGASGHVGALWSAMGGYADAPYAFNWFRILRPLGTARMGLDRIGKAGRYLKPFSGLVTAPGDFLLSKAPHEALREPVSPCAAKAVNAEMLLECIQTLGWSSTLKPVYTAETFPWLMHEAGQNRLGVFRMMTVSDSSGYCGWFIYYALRGGPAFVMQIGVRRKDDFRNVLLALFHDAWHQGSVCVKGAAIPEYSTAMTELGCIFRHPHDRVVVHSKNSEIANAVRTGEAALSRLDGIAWLRFSAEPWDQ